MYLTIVTLLSDYLAEILFWVLVAVGAIWFLTTCWRIIKHPH